MAEGQLLSLGTGFPFTGLDVRTPSIGLPSGSSPGLSNVHVDDSVIVKRHGYTSFSNLWTSDRIMSMFEHVATNATPYLLAVTLYDVFRYDASDSEWKCITETVPEDGVVATELPLHDCEAAWTAIAPNVCVTDNTTGNFKVGAKSNKLTVGLAFGTGVAAHVALVTGGDYTAANGLGFWIKSSLDIAANDLQLVVTEDALGAKTTDYVTFNVPALTAGEWRYCIISGSFAAMNASLTLGLWILNNLAEPVIHFDDIRALRRSTGDASHRIDHVDVFDGTTKKIILTNSNDLPLVWDPSKHGFLQLDVSDFAGLVHVDTVASFYEHLIFANYDDAAVQPQGFSWTSAGTLVTWTTGTGGSHTLADLDGAILRTLPLGNRLVIYASNSIGVATYVGGDAIFAFDTRVASIRVASSRAIVDLGPYHVFLGEDDFYLYDGSTRAISIGEPIQTHLRLHLNQLYAGRSVAYDDRDNHRVLFIVPTTTSALDLVYVLDYDLAGQRPPKWTIMSYNDEISAIVKWSRTSVLSWSSLLARGDKWTELLFEWRSTVTQAGFPHNVLGSSNGSVFESDETVMDDSGVAIDALWESIDFIIPPKLRYRMGRWLEIETELYGDAVNVDYSTNGGFTWTTIETLSLTGSWATYRSYLDVSSERLRIRLRNATLSSSFQLRWVKVIVRSEGRK